MYKPKELLVVMRMQEKFIKDNTEAEAIIKNVADLLDCAEYYKTNGEKLDVYFVMESDGNPFVLTDGRNLDKRILSKTETEFYNYLYVNKNLSEYSELLTLIYEGEYETVTFAGLNTDVEIKNIVLTIDKYSPDTFIRVLEWCSAGTTSLAHTEALEEMRRKMFL